MPGPTNVVPLASKSGNSAVWTPVQALKELIADIEAGKTTPVNMLICYFEELPGGRRRPRRWFVNINPTEEVAMLTLCQHMAIEDWRNP